MLNPGGIAYMAVPNKLSPELLAMRAIPKSMAEGKPFFQHEYTAGEFSRIVENCGFEIVDKATIEMKYPLYVISKHLGAPHFMEKSKRVLFPALDFLEKTPVRNFGTLSIVVARKPWNGARGECFFCGKGCGISPKYSVPVCGGCAVSIPKRILRNYRKCRKPFYAGRGYRRKDSYAGSTSKSRKCKFCGAAVLPDKNFGDLGFSVPICGKCLKDPVKNIDVSTSHLKYEWKEYD